MTDRTILSNGEVGAQYDEYSPSIWKQLHVSVKHASGATIEGFDGNEYLDTFSGISVTNVGHTNDAIIDAAKDQLERIISAIRAALDVEVDQ